VFGLPVNVFACAEPNFQPDIVHRRVKIIARIAPRFDVQRKFRQQRFEQTRLMRG
jgi:hypothetical protein